MKTRRNKVTRKITVLLSAIMLSEQLAGTGAVLYAHAEDEAVAEYTIEHNVNNSWDGGCSAEIILTNLADRETQDWKITFCTKDKITNLWGGSIVDCQEYLVEAASVELGENEEDYTEEEEVDAESEETNDSGESEDTEATEEAEVDEEAEADAELAEVTEESEATEKSETVAEESEIEEAEETKDAEEVQNEETEVSEDSEETAEDSAEVEEAEVEEATESENVADEVLEEELVEVVEEETDEVEESEEDAIYYQYTIEALDYNAIIAAGNRIAIGYNAEGDDHDIWDAKAEIVLKEVEQVEELEEAAVLAGSTYEGDGYTVEVKIPAYWDGAYNVQMVITNTGAETIHNWAFVMETADVITGLYNAVELSNDNNVRLIKNVGYNQDIPVGGSVEVGYTAYYDGNFDVPGDFALSQIETEVTTMECEVSLFISDEWEDGGLAEIIIKNISELPIEDWMIEFDSTLDIKEIWGGVIESHEGEHYFIRNVEYAQNILPGENWNIGFLFSGEASSIRNIEVRKLAITDNSLKIDYEKDSDDDGLPDYYERLIGTDLQKQDTDEDGLTDYEECLFTLSDPLVFDSVQDGISDYDADSDGDEISNGEEIHVELDPMNVDSDYDGLRDGEESMYHTDPLKKDVDKDGIPDGDEIILGLDPLNPATFEIADSEFMFVQKIDSNNACLSCINENETAYQISLEVKAAGLAERNMEVRESAHSKAMSNKAIIGMIPSLEYDGKIEEMTIQFHVEENYRENNLGSYAAYNESFEKLRRLCIGYYSEELDVCMPIETYYNEVAGIVYTTVQMEGTFCLMDLEVWMDMLGIEPKDLQDENKLVAGVETPVIRYFGGHTYAFYDEEWSWNEANEYCQELDGHLLTINHPEEQKFVENIVASFQKSSDYWIGGHCTFDNPYDYVWVTDENFAYNNWSEGEPIGMDRHAIYISKGDERDCGRWYTENRDFAKLFVCEWDGIWTFDGFAETFGEYNGNTYALFANEKKWEAAKEYCEFLGGHLLTIEEVDEQDFIENNIICNTIQSKIWIGGYTKDSLENFEWVTGQKLSYTNWRHGEPNWDYEKYMHLYSWADNDYYGLWNNEPSGTPYPFICEWEGGNTHTELIEENLYFAPSMTKVPKDFGDIVSLNKGDYDLDGLKNCEEIAFGKSQELFQKEYPSINDIYDYYELKYGTPMNSRFKGNNNVIAYFDGIYIVLINSDPTLKDSDGDGIIDYYCDYSYSEESSKYDMDNAPLEKGILLNNECFIGTITIVSCSNRIGHGFLVYHSFIEDTLRFSGFTGGFTYGDWVYTTEKDYDIYPQEYVAIGNSARAGMTGPSHISEIGIEVGPTLAGIYYNREFANEYNNYINNQGNADFEQYYDQNYAYTRFINSDQMDKIIDHLNCNNYYNLVLNNCVIVAAGSWNYAFGHEFNINVLPLSLKEEIAKKEDSYIFDLYDVVLNQFIE
ncbi:MAG: cellulose binding domain-containing protein [Lachnospiraceae bacterium]|nr:cellulose binding domain-containing protein [Lachnospiraceae bacterium]